MPEMSTTSTIYPYLIFAIHDERDERSTIEKAPLRVLPSWREKELSPPRTRPIDIVRGFAPGCCPTGRCAAPSASVREGGRCYGNRAPHTPHPTIRPLPGVGVSECRCHAHVDAAIFARSPATRPRWDADVR